MIIDWASKTLHAKLVYFGPAMGGKTTNIKYLFKKFGLQSNIQSIETTNGRTLFFDWGALYIRTGGDFTIRVDCWSATGQNFYAGTRPTVLLGADGIIFVADAQRKYLTDNVESFQELRNYFGSRLGTQLPLIICQNKTDLTEITDSDELRQTINLPPNVPILKTIAIEGYNVAEAFMLMLKMVFKQ